MDGEMKRFWIRLIVAALLTVCLAVPVSASGIAQITFQMGKAYVGASETGPWQPLAQGASLAQGQYVKTAEGGIVELTLPDRSIIRLAPETVYGIDQAVFTQKKKRRKWSARLVLGRMWSKINRSVGGLRANCDTHTPTAVVGVRGTVFNVDAGTDKSTAVSVVEGRVGVAPPLVTPGAAREEMAWPTEVSEKQWEEIIVSRLQRLHITADGTPGKPEPFDPDAEKDAWIDWNRNRDTLSANTAGPE
jgi:ferric-dicitrate binding protein FerR (iron transport regulator)